jgi:hypothetical protein
MEWWCILLMVKHGNTLAMCILIFQLNQGRCVLGYVQTDATYSGHLLLLILVGQSYLWFITCHQGCVWGWSSCFLSMVIPGQSSPGWNIDVCLRPLIDELTQLWSFRALTYDISRKQNFVMRTALMWTINDFSAYGMVSG